LFSISTGSLGPISGLAPRLAAAMHGLYQQFTQRFPPDDHPHYLSTPRDLTAWVRGMLSHRIDPRGLPAVWRAEGEAVFGTRLVGEEARGRFAVIMHSAMSTAFPGAQRCVAGFFFVVVF
jgi:hypothetical protein